MDLETQFLNSPSIPEIINTSSDIEVASERPITVTPCETTVVELNEFPFTIPIATKKPKKGCRVRFEGKTREVSYDAIFVPTNYLI